MRCDRAADAGVVQEKYEWWWMYMCDAKRKQLLAGPMQICTLGDHDEVLSTLSNVFHSSREVSFGLRLSQKS